MFGLLITFIVGYTTSLLVNIFMGEPEKELDPNLFIPPIANRMKRKNNNITTNGDVSNYTFILYICLRFIK